MMHQSKIWNPFNRWGRTWLTRTSLGSVVTMLSLASPAQAQTEFSQKAAAEAVFHEAAKLLQAGQVEQACGKFEASHKLDPAVGTVLRLGDCYDRLGKTASAWVTFQEAAAMAQAQGQPDRVQIAQERAADLQARLSHVTIEVAATTRSLSDVKVILNEAEIPAAILGTAIPVNPGLQRVQVEAPGYEPWTKQVEVEAAAGNITVSVPELERGIVTEMPTTQLPQPGVASTASGDSSSPARASDTVLQTNRASTVTEDEGSGDAQRLFGYVTGAAGLGALAVGGYFAYRAYDLNNQSLDHCLTGEPNACNETGALLRSDARSNGTTATILGGAGLAVVGASFVLLLTAPSETERPMSMQLTAGFNSAGVELEGVW